jgi:hypothetical protein
MGTGHASPSDQPRAEERRDLGAARQFPEFGESAEQENGKHTESQRELVNAETADIDPRTQRVPFQAQHGRKVEISC